MRASSGRPRGRGAVAHGVVAHGAVERGDAEHGDAERGAGVSMVHAGEHDAERCRRA